MATLVLPHVTGLTEAAFFAWPRYLWFGLMAYPFLTLLVLEPVRPALRGWVEQTPPAPTTATPPRPSRSSRTSRRRRRQ